MAATIVQSKVAFGEHEAQAGGTAPSVTFDSATTSGNTLVVSMGWTSANHATDWTADANLSSFTAHGQVGATVRRTLYSKVSDGSETVFSGSLNNVANKLKGWVLYAYEISGLTASPFDKLGSYSSGTTAETSSQSGSSGTTTQNDEFLMAFLTARGSTFSSPTNSFTIHSQQAAGTTENASQAVLTRTVAATGDYSTAATIDSSQNSGHIITFKIASVSPSSSLSPSA